MKQNKPKTGKNEHEVMINITAPDGIVDGYLELIYGMFAMSGLLRKRAGACKQSVDDNNTMLTEFFILKTPPLGSMGLDDIRDCDPVE